MLLPCWDRAPTCMRADAPAPCAIRRLAPAARRRHVFHRCSMNSTSPNAPCPLPSARRDGADFVVSTPIVASALTAPPCPGGRGRNAAHQAASRIPSATTALCRSRRKVKLPAFDQASPACRALRGLPAAAQVQFANVIAAQLERAFRRFQKRPALKLRTGSAPSRLVMSPIIAVPVVPEGLGSPVFASLAPYSRTAPMTSCGREVGILCRRRRWP